MDPKLGNLTKQIVNKFESLVFWCDLGRLFPDVEVLMTVCIAMSHTQTEVLANGKTAKTPSTAGVVATVHFKSTQETRTYCDFTQVPAGDVVISDATFITAFVSKSLNRIADDRFMPDQVIFYREGIAANQIPALKEQEYSPLSKAFADEAAKRGKDTPRRLCVIVNKESSNGRYLHINMQTGAAQSPPPLTSIDAPVSATSDGASEYAGFCLIPSPVTATGEGRWQVTSTAKPVQYIIAAIDDQVEFFEGIAALLEARLEATAKLDNPSLVESHKFLSEIVDIMGPWVKSGRVPQPVIDSLVSSLADLGWLALTHEANPQRTVPPTTAQVCAFLNDAASLLRSQATDIAGVPDLSGKRGTPLRDDLEQFSCDQCFSFPSWTGPIKTPFPLKCASTLAVGCSAVALVALTRGRGGGARSFTLLSYLCTHYHSHSSTQPRAVLLHRRSS
jgi:hypothetical protein